jgi:hypothetical protein
MLRRLSFFPLLPLLLLFLGECSADKPVAKIDGHIVDRAQLETDQTICRGEVQKATLAQGGPQICVLCAIAWNEAFAGCMAAKGYVAVKQ